MPESRRLHLSEDPAGFSISKGHLSSLWYCGSSFPTGLEYGELVESVVLPFPNEDGRSHMLAFAEDAGRINLVLLHRKGTDGVMASTFSGNSKAFAANCNGFINHAGTPCLSVTNPITNDRYVTAITDATPPGLTVKLVSFDAMLHYITKRATFEELDAAAAAERKARDPLADLQQQNQLISKRLATAEQANRELQTELLALCETAQQLRIQNAVAQESVARQDEALKLALTWAAVLLTYGPLRWLAERKSPVQTCSLLRANQTARMGGNFAPTPLGLATSICNLEQRGKKTL